MATSTVSLSTPRVYVIPPSFQEDLLQAPIPKSSKPKTLGSEAFRAMLEEKAEMLLKGMKMKSDVGLHPEEDM